MKTFFTADLHIGHKNIPKFCPESRGEFVDDIAGMNEAIIDSINSVVGKNRLVILGDIVMGNFEDSITQLARIESEDIVMIPGNHDRWSLAYHHKGDKNKHAGVRAKWREAYEAPFNGRAIAYVDCQPSSWESLFALTGDWADVGGPLHEVKFSHYPYEGDSRDEEDRYQWLRPAPSDVPLVHGHIHQVRMAEKNMLNVGIDAPGRGFVPWGEDEIEAWLHSL